MNRVMRHHKRYKQAPTYWEQYEQDLLVLLYPWMDNEELALKLKRTSKSVRGRASKLFLKKRNPWVPVDEERLDADYEPPRVPDPTTANPGTREKVAVMKRRFALGQWLFHPDDEKVLGHREHYSQGGSHGH